MGKSPRSVKMLDASLWVAQFVIFALFVLFGYLKLFMPIEALAKWWVWPGQLPVWFVRFMGVVDGAGGLGVLLPSLTRIMPRLTVWAALGCVLLQICATVFHASRGEFGALPLNFVLLALNLFVLWGRGRKVPVYPRQGATNT